MTAAWHDDALCVMRDHVDDLTQWVAVWGARAEPGSRAERSCAADAVDALDLAVHELRAVRDRLAADATFRCES